MPRWLVIRPVVTWLALGGMLAGACTAARHTPLPTPTPSPQPAGTPGAGLPWRVPTYPGHMEIKGPHQPQAWRDWLTAYLLARESEIEVWLGELPDVSPFPPLPPKTPQALLVEGREVDRNLMLFARLEDPEDLARWYQDLLQGPWRPIAPNRKEGGFMFGATPGTVMLCSTDDAARALQLATWRDGEGIWLQAWITEPQGLWPAPAWCPGQGPYPTDPFAQVPQLLPPRPIRVWSPGGISYPGRFALQHVRFQSPEPVEVDRLFQHFERTLHQAGWQAVAWGGATLAAWGHWSKASDSGLPFHLYLFLFQGLTPKDAMGYLLLTQGALKQASGPGHPGSSTVQFHGFSDDFSMLTFFTKAMLMFTVAPVSDVRLYVGRAFTPWDAWNLTGFQVLGQMEAEGFLSLYTRGVAPLTEIQRRIAMEAQQHDFLPGNMENAAHIPGLWKFPFLDRVQMFCNPHAGLLTVVSFRFQQAIWSRWTWERHPTGFPSPACLPQEEPPSSLMHIRPVLPLPQGEVVLFEPALGDTVRYLASLVMVRGSDAAMHDWWSALPAQLQQQGWVVEEHTPLQRVGKLQAYAARKPEMKLHILSAALEDHLWVLTAMLTSPEHDAAFPKGRSVSPQNTPYSLVEVHR